MAIISKSQLANIARSKAGPQGLKGSLYESRKYAKSSSVTSVFLSHSHVDKALVEQAKVFFENLGISVYVDWADQTMPEKTSGVTALAIKNQIINANDKFVLLATNAALTSRWCNWEVGIADPFKNPRKKMALFPLADDNGSWTGNEYLQIYPRIERSALDPEKFIVWTPEKNLLSLESWLMS